jgi:hypothetical protein
MPTIKDRLLDIIQPAGYDLITACEMAESIMQAARECEDNYTCYLQGANNTTIDITLTKVPHNCEKLPIDKCK